VTSLSYVDNSAIWQFTTDDSDNTDNDESTPKRIHMIRRCNIGNVDDNNRAVNSESSASANVNSYDSLTIRLDQLESALRIEGLLIRITNIDDGYKNRNEFYTVPISDTIFHSYDLGYGENVPVLSVNEPISNPDLEKKCIEELTIELTDHIKSYIGENRRVNTRSEDRCTN
jgi:hypothetical protein